MQKTILLIGAGESFRTATALVLARAGHIVYADLLSTTAGGEISAMADHKDLDLRPMAVGAVSESAIEAGSGESAR